MIQKTPSKQIKIAKINFLYENWIKNYLSYYAIHATKWSLKIYIIIMFWLIFPKLCLCVISEKTISENSKNRNFHPVAIKIFVNVIKTPWQVLENSHLFWKGGEKLWLMLNFIKSVFLNYVPKGNAGGVEWVGGPGQLLTEQADQHQPPLQPLQQRLPAHPLQHNNSCL